MSKLFIRIQSDASFSDFIFVQKEFAKLLNDFIEEESQPVLKKYDINSFVILAHYAFYTEKRNKFGVWKKAHFETKDFENIILSYGCGEMAERKIHIKFENDCILFETDFAQHIEKLSAYILKHSNLNIIENYLK